MHRFRDLRGRRVISGRNEKHVSKCHGSVHALGERRKSMLVGNITAPSQRPPREARLQ